MNTVTLQKKLEYRDCPIYIRRHDEMWEYLTVMNNEIYTASIVAKKSGFKNVMGKDYSAKEISDITQYMIAMAQTTIDQVLGEEKPTKKKVVKSPFIKQ
jgi:hypothetical protein